MRCVCLWYDRPMRLRPLRAKVSGLLARWDPSLMLRSMRRVDQGKGLLRYDLVGSRWGLSRARSAHARPSSSPTETSSWWLLAMLCMGAVVWHPLWAPVAPVVVARRSAARPRASTEHATSTTTFTRPPRGGCWKVSVLNGGMSVTCVINVRYMHVTHVTDTAMKENTLTG